MKCLGIYIHIPFCIRKCNYCDFCSYTNRSREDMIKYTEELCRRIRSFAQENAQGRTVDTVYFGGGTPTLLPAECFRDIINTVSEVFDVKDDAEITAECNPASIDRNGLEKLRILGVNRLSIGLQSANNDELKALGRLHSFEDFCENFNQARAVGFDNISVDLMYSLPNQTTASFENTLKAVCDLSPEHISAYGLKIEENTEFYKTRNTLHLPDEDDEYDMYCLCERILKQYGYRRYEISNFAKAGKESRHNLKYWRLDDYIGFGVASHSCFEGERFGNSRDIQAFLNGEDIIEERSYISNEEKTSEYIMLGLRLEEGIELKKYREMTGRDFKQDFPQTDKLVSEGFLIENSGRLAFTTKGVFVSNVILSDMTGF